MANNLLESVDQIRRLEIENWADLPEEVREELFKLGQVGVSPRDRLEMAAEVIHAHGAKIGKKAVREKAQDVAAQAVETAMEFGFLPPDRGPKLLKHLKRQAAAGDVLEIHPALRKEQPTGPGSQATLPGSRT